MYKITALLITVLLIGFSVTLAQDARSRVEPKTVVSGNEMGQPVEVDVFTSEPVSFGPVNSGSLLWTVNNITNRQSGYDLQSNGSTQQIWYDLNNPGYVHATFCYSSVCDNAWADRTSLYFGSTDGGANWFELGGVPVNNGTTGRSGFPSIIGTSTGAAVIANHNNAETPTRSTIFIDNSPFEYSFTNYAPPGAPFNNGDPIWPLLAINASDDIVLASSVNTGDSFYVNTLSGGVFSGWQVFNGDQAETHSLNFSDGGKVGLAWIGGIGQDGNVTYIESTDDGLTWSTPLTIFTAIPDPALPTDIYGPIRGVNVNFHGEEPVVVFEAGWQTTSATYYPGREADIRFWSPNINGGVPKVIADSNNVGGFYPNYGVSDVMWHMARPVIGRSEMHDYLFVAFQTTSGEYWPGASSADSTAFFRGMFMYSTNGGETWTDPEQFTPTTTPTLDFSFASIVPVAPVAAAPDDDIITVHLAMQGDPMPASTANGWGIMPPSITAQYYHFTTEILVVGVDDEIVANNFNLEQNYPNPFNPSTTIKYTLGERSAVTLKVYDVLGNEVANLVNTNQEAGKYSINFDASSLSSGLYIYTLNTGNFTSSKKMMLLK
jgi:hypothetical protein